MVGWMRGLVNGLQNRVHPFESGTDLATGGCVKKWTHSLSFYKAQAFSSQGFVLSFMFNQCSLIPVYHSCFNHEYHKQ